MIHVSATGVEGFTPVDPLIDAPPLLAIGGGTPDFGGGLTWRSHHRTSTSTTAARTEVGSIISNEDVTNLLGLTNTEFTVSNCHGGGRRIRLVGTTGRRIGVRRLQPRRWIENVYTAIPGLDGGGRHQVTDTLVTPFGNLDLSDLFGGVDARSLLNPGDAFGAGLDGRPPGSPKR